MGGSASKKSLICRVVASDYNSFPFPIHSIELAPPVRERTIISLEFQVNHCRAERLSYFLRTHDSEFKGLNLRALTTLEPQIDEEVKTLDREVLICRMEYLGRTFRSPKAAAKFLWRLSCLLGSPSVGRPSSVRQSKKYPFLYLLVQQA
jgi:hypothetical protein